MKTGKIFDVGRNGGRICDCWWAIRGMLQEIGDKIQEMA